MKITLYTLPVCYQCKLTKKWLDRARVEYTTVDLSTSPLDAAAVAVLGYKQAPVIIVSTGNAETDIHFSGFQPAHLARYLGSAVA